MRIYIRVSENQQSISGEERWNSYDKRMILKKCWLSLMMNITSSDELIIYHHDVRQETLNWMSDKCSTLHNFIKVSSIEESLVKPLEDMKKEIKTEKDENKLWAYLEDDYLWNSNGLKVIKEASQYWRGFITPNDTPRNYLEPKKAHIFVGIERYWRTSNYISYNLIGSTEVFRKYIDHIKNTGIMQNMSKLQEILDTTECLVPLPGVATHCKDSDMSPLVDWNFIMEGIKV